ncbi:MAG: transposase [bacterium]
MRHRRVRFEFPGHAHELTFSCFHNQPFLLHEGWCRVLADAVNRAREKYDFNLWAYVFMPDHVHLMICPQQSGCSIANILQTIKQSSSRRVLNFCRREASYELTRFETGQTARPYRFWQDGGGYDRNIIKPETLIAAIEYIHANPVRKGLVQTPAEWYWSSCADWSGLVRGPVGVDRETLEIMCSPKRV